MPKLSAYEIQKAENIRKNKELLQSLGLDKPLFEPKETKPKKKPAPPKKRKSSPAPEDEPAPKALKTMEDNVPSSGSVRRSSRNAGKTVDYKASNEGLGGPVLPVPISFKSGVRTTENEGPVGCAAGSKRLHNPKQYGSIPDVEVGTWWESREACSDAAIHAPWVAGIAPGPKGAYSIALSGGYEDDIDLGYGFTFTGCGGRDLKGTAAQPKNLRTAPQSSDQTFKNNCNRALKDSSETKKPVRVIRGYKLKSKYGPSEGYRYDGLYTVERAWIEPGNNPGGFKVCKFAFKRIANQPPLPVRDGTPDAGENEDSEDSADTTSEE